MPERVRGNEYRTTILCVDSYDEEVLVGRLCNPYLNEEESFHGTMRFLIQMEALLDRMHLPQSFTASRSFTVSPEEDQGRSPTPVVRDGQRATFALRVLFRQNASWQGSMTWLDRGQEKSFRSALELLLLLHSALSE
jgi:hypothetical protein